MRFCYFSIALIDIVPEIVKKMLPDCTLRVWPVPEALFALFNWANSFIIWNRSFPDFPSLCIAKGSLNGRCRIRGVHRLRCARVDGGRREAVVESV